MKKLVSIFITISILLCAFAYSVPSYALEYNDFTYEIENESIVITGYAGSDTEITIPAEIDGVSVIKIGDDAFKDNTAITSVTVSEGIEDIGGSAFENCTALATITLPATITHFGKNAIYNTAYYNDESNWKLKRTVTDTDLSIGAGEQETISWEDVLAPTLQYLYLDTVLVECEYSGKYRIKQGTTVIADYAFVKSVDAKIIQFQSSLISVGSHAFDGCTSIEELDVADSVEFDATSFYNTGFYNNTENWENGALYLGSRLVSASGDEIIVKDGTTQIVSGAVNGRNVVIPKSVTDIHINAFANTENVVIFGYADTVAQSFANENDITFIDLENFIKGDVNFNGALDSEDYEILCSISTLQQIPSFTASLVGDMNEDGAIDGLDVIILDLIFNGIGPSTIKGDVDGNGEVNENDYTLLTEIVTLNAEITDVYMFDRCDLNSDGAVDSFDVMYLDLALNGLTALI